MLTKSVLGESYPADAFLHVPDVASPETWDLLVWESTAKGMTPKSMHRAAMNLRSNKALKPGDREAAVRKLHGKYMEKGVRKRDLPAALQAGMAYAATRRKMKNASRMAESILTPCMSDTPSINTQEWAKEVQEDDSLLNAEENPYHGSHLPSLLDGDLPLETIVGAAQLALAEYHALYHGPGQPGAEQGGAWDGCTRLIATSPDRIVYEVAGKTFQRSYQMEGTAVLLDDDEIEVPIVTTQESLTEARGTEIREAFLAQPLREAKLDRENRVIHNTVVITRESANGPNGKRRYSDKALREIARRSEGIESHLNHAPREQAYQARQVQELAGRHINVRFDEANHRVMSDFKVLATQADMVFALAQDMPDIVGNSIVARGEVRMEGDTEIVDDILEVRCVDLVSSPGATRGLFEHLETWRATHPQGETPMDVTLEKILEALDKSGAMATAVKEHLAGKDLKSLAEEKATLAVAQAKTETEMAGIRKELDEAKVALAKYAAAEAIATKKTKLAEAIDKSDLGAGKPFQGYASDMFQSALLVLDEAKWDEQIGDLVATLKKAAGAKLPQSEGKGAEDLAEGAPLPDGAHQRMLRLVTG